MFWVSLPGIPISLGIWVWGHPKHGDTQITLTRLLLSVSSYPPGSRVLCSVRVYVPQDRYHFDLPGPCWVSIFGLLTRPHAITYTNLLQLITQLMQLRKESLKKSGLPGFEPWPLRYRCSALTNWANKPTGSWSLNWFVIYPGEMKMKLWIYEIHIFELRNEEINVKKAFFSQLHKLRY